MAAQRGSQAWTHSYSHQLPGKRSIALEDPSVRDAGNRQACRQGVQGDLIVDREDDRERAWRNRGLDGLAGGVYGLRGGDTWREIDPQDHIVAEGIVDRPGVNGS